MIKRTANATVHERETRDRILTAARRLFHVNGYTAVGVADICREASVVKGSFYHFFPSKVCLNLKENATNDDRIEPPLGGNRVSKVQRPPVSRIWWLV